MIVLAALVHLYDLQGHRDAYRRKLARLTALIRSPEIQSYTHESLKKLLIPPGEEEPASGLATLLDLRNHGAEDSGEVPHSSPRRISMS